MVNRATYLLVRDSSKAYWKLLYSDQSNRYPVSFTSPRAAVAYGIQHFGEDRFIPVRGVKYRPQKPDVYREV